MPQTPDRFEAVTLHDQYPRQDVADHEVFMGFVNDADALAFREWWQEKGASAFGAWLKRRTGKRGDADGN